MTLVSAAGRLCEAFGSSLQARVAQSPADLSSLLAEVGATQCSASEFLNATEALEPEQAATLLVATLHRSIAYSTEILPIDQARTLAADFIAAAGPDASFYSTCEAADEFNGIGGWSLMITGHTFESVLYCVGRAETALLVAVDED
jgi:hypothetical protein